VKQKYGTSRLVNVEEVVVIGHEISRSRREYPFSGRDVAEECTGRVLLASDGNRLRLTPCARISFIGILTNFLLWLSCLLLPDRLFEAKKIRLECELFLVQIIFFFFFFFMNCFLFIYSYRDRDSSENMK